MDENAELPAVIRPAVKKNKANPFLSGFIPTGKRKKATTTYLTKRSLLKTMLEVDVTIQDLPTVLADHLRNTLPGWFDNVERRFTMRQIMELVQFQLLFSPSDHVKQDAINAIKDRVDGKAVQKMVFETEDPDPTELVLPNGRKIIL
jgi:hypothetical protein